MCKMPYGTPRTGLWYRVLCTASRRKKTSRLQASVGDRLLVGLVNPAEGGHDARAVPKIRDRQDRKKDVDVDVPFRSTTVLYCGPTFLNNGGPVITTKNRYPGTMFDRYVVDNNDRVGRSSPSPQVQRAQCRAESCPAPSCRACRCDAMRWLLPQPRAGQNGQVPNTACDSRDVQYSVPRTNLHISLSTSLIRLVSFVQVRALLQIQIELDPHPNPLPHPHQRSFRPRFALVASDLGCDSSGCGLV